MSLPSPLLGAALMGLLAAPQATEPRIRQSPIDASMATTDALATVNAVESHPRPAPEPRLSPITGCAPSITPKLDAPGTVPDQFLQERVFRLSN